MDHKYSNGWVRQLVSKYSGKGIEGSRLPPFSSELLRKWVYLSPIKEKGFKWIRLEVLMDDRMVE